MAGSGQSATTNNTCLTPSASKPQASITPNSAESSPAAKEIELAVSLRAMLNRPGTELCTESPKAVGESSSPALNAASNSTDRLTSP